MANQMRCAPDVGLPRVVVAPGDRLVLEPDLAHGRRRLLHAFEVPALVRLDQHLPLVRLGLLARRDTLLPDTLHRSVWELNVRVDSPAHLAAHRVLRDAHVLCTSFPWADGRHL